MASLAFGDDDNNNNNNNNNNYSNLNIGYAAAGKMMRTRSEESRMKRDSEIAKKLQEQFNQEDMEAIERRRKEIEEDDSFNTRFVRCRIRNRKMQFFEKKIPRIRPDSIHR